MKHFIVLFLLIFFAVGCASSRGPHEKLRVEVKNGNFDAALEIVKSDKFYPDKNSRLLKLMETSLLQHLKGNYFQAMQGLDQARELSDELFTVSISKKIAGAVGNSNADNYYGEPYERSMIRFYQALNHYSLFQSGQYEAYTLEEKNTTGKGLTKKEMPAKKLSDKEKQFHLTAARSTLLEWNSLLDNYKSTTAGKPVYKDDLLAKVFGAFIHEQMGTAQDKSIALGLYKEAKQVLFKNYNILPTYNKKSSDFVKNFELFGTMEEGQVLKKYVEKTPTYTDLENFIDMQITRLGSNESNSLFVMIENDLITPKTAKKFDFPIPVATIPANLGGDFLSFTGKVLKADVNTAPKIYFEMPMIDYKRPNIDSTITIKDSKGAVVATNKMATFNPLSDLAQYTLSENSVSNYAKVGARVALKHITALTTAYALYAKKKGTNETLAMLAAGAAYSLASKGIEMSEEADLRSWSILPRLYSLATFKLRPGTYSVEYQANKKDAQVHSLGNISVADSGPTTLLKHRIYD